MGKVGGTRQRKDGLCTNPACRKPCDRPSSNYCGDCRRERQRRVRNDPATKQREIDRQKKWKEGNPESRKKTRRKSHLKSLYGITHDEYEEMYEAQDGRCAACGIPEADAPRGWLSVDHDHDTGIVRGLLCAKCNFALGHLDDDPVKILWLFDYITERGVDTDPE